MQAILLKLCKKILITVTLYVFLLICADVGLFKDAILLKTFNSAYLFIEAIW